MSLEHADIIVKKHLLNHPTLFKSRLDALVHILIVEDQAQWTSDGFVFMHNMSSVDDPAIKMAKVPHLEEPPYVNENILALEPSFYDIPKIERKMELMKLAFIEENINEFAQNNFKFQDKMSLVHLNMMSINSLIFSVPDVIHPSWKKAVLEVLDAIISELKTKYERTKNNNDKSFDTDGLGNKPWFELLTSFTNIRDKISPNTEKKLAKGVYDLYKSLSVAADE